MSLGARSPRKAKAKGRPAALAEGRSRRVPPAASPARKASGGSAPRAAGRQQAEILRVIWSSPTDVQPVFETIAESAARLCGASDGGSSVDGDLIHFVAHVWLSYRSFRRV